ncbi:MAG: hypothetical protein INR65_19805 [Gluconacetobacter diazotrophicus]|nr:hypothetical protein [Gluconacetobacter diazotrophicus]
MPGTRHARFTGVLLAGTVLCASPEVRARQNSAPAAPGVATTANATPQENLTVHGQRRRFESAPVPGAPLGPPPENPDHRDPHLGRYKITGSEPGPGYDPHTGAFIAPFGDAYTQAGPVAGGLATRFNH